MCLNRQYRSAFRVSAADRLAAGNGAWCLPFTPVSLIRHLWPLVLYLVPAMVLSDCSRTSRSVALVWVWLDEALACLWLSLRCVRHCPPTSASSLQACQPHDQGCMKTWPPSRLLPYWNIGRFLLAAGKKRIRINCTEGNGRKSVLAWTLQPDVELNNVQELQD